MDQYVDDPTPLVEQMDTAWERYIAQGQEVYDALLSQVTEWRFTDGMRLTPRHPLSNAFDVGDHSNWRPRPIRFVAENPDAAQIRHGLDGDGRVIVAGNRLVRYDDGFHDILTYQKVRDPLTRELTDRVLLYEPHFQTGYPNGRFTRCLTDEAGRIVRTARLSNEGEEPQRHYRVFESFRREGDRVVESFRQFFTRATEPDEDYRDLPPEELANRDRRVHDHLREVMGLRSRFEYSYDEAGVLSQVAEYRPSGERKHVWYSYNPKDTIENLTAELAAVVGKALIKTIKAAKAARPVRFVALQYSAEHTHCGLPSAVLLTSANDSTDPLDWETYPHAAAWPPEGRIGQKYEDLQCRLQIAVEGSPKYAEDFQPRPYREVLWRASRAVYDSLASKRMTSDDFAVFPLDDHGDVDPADDVRESLPAEVAETLLKTADGG